MALGRKIKELRIARGWSQTRLSKISAVDQATISHIEVGRVQRPSDETLRKLAVGLGVRVELLLAVAGALDAPSPDRAGLADLGAWLESRARPVELLGQV